MKQFWSRVFSSWRSTSRDFNGGPKVEENVEVKNQIIIEGSLFKKSSNIFQTWNRRHFVIQDNKLMYRNKFKHNPTVMIKDLQLCTVDECEYSWRRFCFQVVSPTKTCILQADSGEKRQAWITVIRNIIVKSHNRKDRSKKLNLLRLSSSIDSLESFSTNKLPDKIPYLCGQQKIFSDVSEFKTFRQYQDTQIDLQLGYKASAAVWKIGKPFIQRTFSTSTNIFDSLYTVGGLLGQGGYGSVFDGVRKADGKQVAVKYVKKDMYCRVVTIPGETERLPVEVALMQMACKPPRCKHVIELLEWFEMPDHILLILEKPVPCMDLCRYRQRRRLHESVAKIIMWQVVEAVRHCRDRGVMHFDIKEENLLINLESLEVKLIDFGCGDLLISTPYRKYLGTVLCSPPEWSSKKEYSACSATVWSLGLFLYILVCGKRPFWTLEDIAEGKLKFTSGVSESCCHLIRSCMMKDPYSRPSLEMILQHQWFQEYPGN